MHPEDADGHDSDTSAFSDVSAATVTTRVPYSEAEDVGVIHFLIQSGQLHLVKGNKIWREAAIEKSDPPQRSWQSLKNRFFANILPNISNNKYHLLSDEHRSLILRNCGRGKRELKDADESDSGESVSERVAQDPYLSYLRQMEIKDSRRRRSRRKDSRHSPDGSQSSSSASAADVDQDQDQDRLPQKEDGNVRRNFTDEEDTVILNYILKRIKWSRKTGDQIQLRGMLFWTTMRKDTANGRTAHSLRERFLKRILPHLNKYLHIQPVEAAAIRKLAISAKSNQ